MTTFVHFPLDVSKTSSWHDFSASSAVIWSNFLLIKESSVVLFFDDITEVSGPLVIFGSTS